MIKFICFFIGLLLLESCQPQANLSATEQIKRHNRVDFSPDYTLKTPKLQFSEKELAAFYAYYYSSFSKNATGRDKNRKSPRAVVNLNGVSQVHIYIKENEPFGFTKDSMLIGLFFFMENYQNFNKAAKIANEERPPQKILPVHHLGGFNFVTADLDTNFIQKMHRNRFSRRRQEKIYELKLTLYYLPDLIETQTDSSSKEAERAFISKYPDTSPKTYYIRNGNIIKVNDLYYKVVFQPNALLRHQNLGLYSKEVGVNFGFIKFFFNQHKALRPAILSGIVNVGSALVMTLIRPDSLPASMPNLPFNTEY